MSHFEQQIIEGSDGRHYTVLSVLDTPNISNINPDQSINFDPTLPSPSQSIVTIPSLPDPSQRTIVPISSLQKNNPNYQGDLRSPSVEIPLREWLNKSVDGQDILVLYDDYQMLDDSSKNKLVALILQRETDGLPELPEIKPHIYIKLAQEIVKTFPTEAEGVYYVPRIRKTKLQDGIPPQGKLLHHYSYIKRVHAAKRKLITQQINVEQTRVIPDLDDANEKIQFLMNNIEPWEEIIQKWDESFDERSQILKHSSDAESYFQKFPCLRQPLGIQLLKKDFDRIYQDKHGIFSRVWPQIRSCLIILMNGIRKPKDKNFSNLINQLSTFTESALDAAVLWLLPALFKKPGPISFNSYNTQSSRAKRPKTSEENRWNPTTAEVQRSFVFYIETVNNQREAIDSLNKWAQQHKIPLQPRPVIVGPLTDIKSSFVLVNNTLYNAESPAHAVDLAFSLYHILHLQFPLEAKSPWLFIQKLVYEIDTVHDRTIPSSVTGLISDVRAVFNQLQRN